MRCQSNVLNLFKENNNEGARGYIFVWVNGTWRRLKGHEQQRALLLKDIGLNDTQIS